MTEWEFLRTIWDREIPVVIYLMNGFQIHGVITDTDDNMVWVKDGGTKKAIYKHAISTIVPVREIKGESGDKEVEN